MSEEDVGVQGRCHVLVIGELFAIVEGDRVNALADGSEFAHGCLTGGLSCGSGQERDFGQLCFALDEREQPALVPCTDDRVAFPIADAALALDDGGTLGYVDSIGNQATSGGFACAFVVPLTAPAQTVPQITALVLVLPDHLIDPFVAERCALLGKPTADLLRRPASRAQLGLDPSTHSLGQLAWARANLLPRRCLCLRLLEPVAAASTVPA